MQYVSKDKQESVLFVFRVHIPDDGAMVKLPPIHLRGLDEDFLYSIDGFDEPHSGKAWMETGVTVKFINMQSKVLRIKRVN